MTKEKISDRHLRTVDGLQSAAASKALRVRISAGSAAATAAGQHLLVCTANLLGRMTDLVEIVEIDVPSVEVVVSLPHTAAAMLLPEAMSSLITWAVGADVLATTALPDTPAHFHLCIGGDVRAPVDAFGLHAIADGWRAWVGTVINMPSARAFTSKNPLGPFFAATLLVGEVFKRARGIQRGRWIEDLAHSLWTGTSGPWNELDDGPDLAGRALPPIYLIGAGAVGQGLLSVTGAAQFAETYIVTIDDDIHDTTNFNRCFISGISDKGRGKVEAVTRYRSFTGLDGFEFSGTIAQYLQRPRPGLRADLAEAEAEDQFDCVISCVDKGTSRQDVQGLWPRTLLGGSTLGLGAKTNVYDLAAGDACLGCHNPPEQNGALLRKVEQQVRGMTESERTDFFGEVKDRAAILAYLASADRCGVVGEAEFRAFATQGEREFSVSFVSMAASVLLASRLFSRLIFTDAPEGRLPPMSSFAFLNGSVEHGRLSIDGNCRKCGGDPTGSFMRNSPFAEGRHRTDVDCR